MKYEIHTVNGMPLQKRITELLRRLDKEWITPRNPTEWSDLQTHIKECVSSQLDKAIVIEKPNQQVA